MIYFMKCIDPDSNKYGLIKIGTTDDIHMRISALSTEHGKLEILGMMDGGRGGELALHERFAPHKANVAWREWFFPNATIYDYIEANTHLNMPDRVSGVIRVDDVTATAIVMLRADVQLKTGRRITNNDLIWGLIEKHHPEIVEHVRSLMQKEGKTV